MTTYIQRIQNAIDEANIAEIEAIHQEAAEEVAAAERAAWEAELAIQEAEAEATRRNFVPWSNLTDEDRFQLVLHVAEQVLRNRRAEGGPWYWGTELPTAEELPEAVSTHLSQGFLLDDRLDYIIGEAARFWVNAAYEDLEEFGDRPRFFETSWLRTL